MKYLKRKDKNGKDIVLAMPETKDELIESCRFNIDRPYEDLAAIPNEFFEEWREQSNKVELSGLNQVEIIEKIFAPIVRSSYVDGHGSIYAEKDSKDFEI